MRRGRRSRSARILRPVAAPAVASETLMPTARADGAHQRRHRRGEKLERAETRPLREQTPGQGGGIERADRVEMMGELHAVW